MKKVSNASFYTSWNFVLGKMLFESCNHSSCVETKHLDQKNHFRFGSPIPLQTKPNYLLATTQGFHVSLCRRMPSPPSTHSSYQSPRPALRLPSKPILEIPSLPDSQPQFPVQRPVPAPVPHTFWNPFPLQPQFPLQLPVRLLPQTTPLDQPYTESF